jgi:hypothetical protein
MKLTSRFQLPEELPREISRVDDKFGSAANDVGVVDTESVEATPKIELQESVAPIIASAPKNWFLNFINYFDGWSTDPFADDEAHVLMCCGLFALNCSVLTKWSNTVKRLLQAIA